MEVSLAIAAPATLRTSLIASATCPMPDIADSVVCFTSCTRCCTTNNPIGDTIRHGRGETECKQDNAWPLANAEFGALDDIVVELLGICPARGTNVVVSSTIVPLQ